MPFVSNGKVHTHIKELAAGHEKFRRGKKLARLPKFYLHALDKAKIDYSVFASQTGRNCGSVHGSSGSKRYYISVNSSDYEEVSRIVESMDKGRYKASMENHAFPKNLHLERIDILSKRLPFEGGLNDLEPEMAS